MDCLSANRETDVHNADCLWDEESQELRNEASQQNEPNCLVIPPKQDANGWFMFSLKYCLFLFKWKTIDYCMYYTRLISVGSTLVALTNQEGRIYWVIYITSFTYKNVSWSWGLQWLAFHQKCDSAQMITMKTI